jgi:WD40 repeat protein
LKIYTHGGDDDVSLAECSMQWQLTDYPTSVLIVTGGGNDTVELYDVDTRGDVSVSTGSGDDEVLMDEIDVLDQLFADLGSGDDTLTLLNSSAEEAHLWGGSHINKDALVFQDNAFAWLDKTGWEA